MRLVLVVSMILGAAAGSCHLADDPEPPPCPSGFHVEVGRCQEDETAAYLATLGKGCALTPEVLRVPASTDFMFRNADEQPHVVTGIDGKLRVEIPAGQTSPFLQISRPGTYPYSVSGCETGGAIAVE